MKSTVILRGFTLIELLIIMALVAILASLAAPSMQQMIANQALSSVASDLMTDSLQARSIAMAKNAQVVIEPVDSAWTNGWKIYIDKDRNESFTSGTDTLILTKEAMPSSVVIDTAYSQPARFTYESSGYLNSTTNGRVAIKSNLTTRKRQVIIEKSGRPRICDPSKSTC